MAGFSELARRIEVAPGPDREIDDAVWAACDAGWRTTARANAEAGGYLDLLVPPSFTSSLDAAVLLVERLLPGWYWRAGKSTIWNGWAHLNRVHPDHCDKKDEASAHAATPTLALLAAALHAVSALPSDPNRSA